MKRQGLTSWRVVSFVLLMVFLAMFTSCDCFSCENGTGPDDDSNDTIFVFYWPSSPSGFYDPPCGLRMLKTVDGKVLDIETSLGSSYTQHGALVLDSTVTIKNINLDFYTDEDRTVCLGSYRWQFGFGEALIERKKGYSCEWYNINLQYETVFTWEQRDGMVDIYMDYNRVVDSSIIVFDVIGDPDFLEMGFSLRSFDFDEVLWQMDTYRSYDFIPDDSPPDTSTDWMDRSPYAPMEIGSWWEMRHFRTDSADTIDDGLYYIEVLSLESINGYQYARLYTEEFDRTTYIRSTIHDVYLFIYNVAELLDFDYDIDDTPIEINTFVDTDIPGYTWLAFNPIDTTVFGSDSVYTDIPIDIHAEGEMEFIGIENIPMPIGTMTNTKHVVLHLFVSYTVPIIGENHINEDIHIWFRESIGIVKQQKSDTYDIMQQYNIP